MSQDKLPEDVKEIIQIVQSGKLPKEKDILKCDFVTKNYLSKAIFSTIGALICLIVIFSDKRWQYQLVYAGFSAWLIYRAFKNFTLLKEAKKGNCYLLFSPKYFIFRVGENIEFYSWRDMENIDILVRPEDTTDGQIAHSYEALGFKYDNKNIKIDLASHLGATDLSKQQAVNFFKKFYYIKQQMLRYKNLYGLTNTETQNE